LPVIIRKYGGILWNSLSCQKHTSRTLHFGSQFTSIKKAAYMPHALNE
jgi:hypothetical protein